MASNMAARNLQLGLLYLKKNLLNHARKVVFVSAAIGFRANPRWRQSDVELDKRRDRETITFQTKCKELRVEDL